MVIRKPIIIMLCFLLFVLGVACTLGQTLLPSGQKLLVWIGEGAFAGQHNSANAGELVWMDGGEATETVMTLPPQTTRVVPCGDSATSLDRRYFAFMVGDDARGTLYLVDGVSAPIVVKSGVSAMACVGNGTFRYNPDGTLLAYLDFLPTISTEPYASGVLNIAPTADPTSATTFEAVAAFDMNKDYVAFLSLFEDERGQANEAAVITYDGNTDREVATLFASNGCAYTSASLAILTPELIAVVMGHKCAADGRTSWQFYTVDVPNRSATLALSDVQTGSYLTFARTNYVLGSVDGSAAFFTTADGITTHTSGVFAVLIADLTLQPIIPNVAVMPRLTNRPYAAENALPVRSPDGNWWALARNTANNEASIAVVDLANPQLPPIELSAGGRGDQVTSIVFAPDSSKVYYVAGGHSGGNNSLFSIELATGTEERVRRGRYGQALISPDGEQMALISWQVVADNQPPFTNLILLNLETTEETTLFVGATVNQNRVTNQRFIYPLAWRGGL